MEPVEKPSQSAPEAVGDCLKDSRETRQYRSSWGTGRWARPGRKSLWSPDAELLTGRRGQQ